MIVKINKTICQTCQNVFYEWDDVLNETCPYCGGLLDDEDSALIKQTIDVRLELDPQSGRIDIV